MDIVSLAPQMHRGTRTLRIASHAALALVLLVSGAWCQAPSFLTKWGSSGSGDGQFGLSGGVATDGSGNVYVVDTDNNRIQKFDSAGTFLTKWGSPGSGDGQFFDPRGIATDGSGNVYVVDGGNSRIQKFDSAGTFLTKWGSPGSADGQLNDPRGIATDGSGNVYVAEAGNSRIQKFDSAGTFLTKWGSSGTGDGEFQFFQRANVATDGSGNVYVNDEFNFRIQVFGSSPFTVAANIDTLSMGDTATLRTFAGEPGKLALLFIVAVNGSPFLAAMTPAVVLDGNGTWTLTATVPNEPNLPGSTLTVRTFSFDALGNIIETNDEVLSFL